MSGDEIRLASEAAHYLASLRQPLFWATVANPYIPERDLRDLIRLFKSIIAKEQDRCGLAHCLWLEILEGAAGVHGNLLFPLKGRTAETIAARMMASERLGGDTLLIKRASTVGGALAFVAYHSKERTPQAQFVGGENLAKRVKGSHPLGAGGGDRVRLSEALMGQLVSSGRVVPHQRVYASRALPVVMAIEPAIIPITIPDLDLGLFGAGLPITKAAPKERLSINRLRFDQRYDDQCVLPLELPPTAIDLAPRLGSTHQEIAEKLGISRQQVSNILNGQFGPSRWVARRIVELARAA